MTTDEIIGILLIIPLISALLFFEWLMMGRPKFDWSLKGTMFDTPRARDRYRVTEEIERKMENKNG